MPYLRIPGKYCLHRQACLALYRALLRESSPAGSAAANAIMRTGTSNVSTSSSSTALTETLRSLIRFRFHKDKTIASLHQAGKGLVAGHEYLTLLRSCSAGSSPAIARLLRTLAQVTTLAESTAAYRAEVASRWKPPPESRIPHMRNLRAIASKKNHESTPSDRRIFHHPRPLSTIKSGVRKVPNLIITQGIPLVKYPGPVPVLVNRVLKKKILWGVNMWRHHSKLMELIEVAEAEDEWDALLSQHTNYKDPGRGLFRRPRFSSTRERPRSTMNRFGDRGKSDTDVPDSWATHLQEVDKELEKMVLQRRQKYAKLGNEYWHRVIVKERELKELERRQAKQARRTARRRAEGEGAEGSDDVSSISSGFL